MLRHHNTEAAEAAEAQADASGSGAARRRREAPRSNMALIPSQVLRVAILLSYFSILCHYKALDMPAHQTYGGSWKFLTFIDLVPLHRDLCLLNPRRGLAASAAGGGLSVLRGGATGC